jgi:catechol 2,3-dioxygenase-like lactoylglutathione lyase family enzyme
MVPLPLGLKKRCNLKGIAMPESTRLAAQPHVTFVPISDKDKALAFYRDQLGLTFVDDQSPFALVFHLTVPGDAEGDVRENLEGEPGTGGEGIARAGNDNPAALKLASGTVLRATFAGDFKPQPFTILGWRVADIEAVASELTAAGVVFNRYPGMNDQHPLAIWTAPGGTQVAWFTDPFGNVLSLQQDPSA